MFKLKRRPQIRYNHGSKPIFISRSIKDNTNGLRGEMEQMLTIMPGEGIDLNYLDLYEGKPGKSTGVE